MEWTGGSVIFAAGNPLSTFEYKGKRVVPPFASNMYIFPAMGLATTVCRPTEITQDMFLAASHRLCSLVPEEALEQGHLFPHLKNCRVVSKEIAIDICKVAFEKGLAQVEPPTSERHLRTWVCVYLSMNI